MASKNPKKPKIERISNDIIKINGKSVHVGKTSNEKPGHTVVGWQFGGRKNG